MSALLVDTHTAIWFVHKDPRISRAAIWALRESTNAGDPIFIASISFVEMSYLAEKGRISWEARRRVLDSLDASTAALQMIPLDRAVIDAIGDVPRSAVPDLPDRVIAATALAYGLTIVTKDAEIRACGVTTIW